MTHNKLLGPAGTGRPHFLISIVVSGAVVLALVGATGFGIGWYFERSALSRERAVTGAAVETLAQRHLTPADFEFKDSPVDPKRFEIFQEIPGIFRVKVFDQSGRVLWSDESRLIGQRFPPGPNLQKALKGQVAMVLEAPTREEHLYEFTRGFVAETYVPISFRSGSTAAGVIETYRDVTGEMQDVRRTQYLIWAVAGTIGLLCYIVYWFRKM